MVNATNRKDLSRVLVGGFDGAVDRDHGGPLLKSAPRVVEGNRHDRAHREYFSPSQQGTRVGRHRLPVGFRRIRSRFPTFCYFPVKLKVLNGVKVLPDGQTVAPVALEDGHEL